MKKYMSAIFIAGTILSCIPKPMEAKYAAAKTLAALSIVLVATPIISTEIRGPLTSNSNKAYWAYENARKEFAKGEISAKDLQALKKKRDRAAKICDLFSIKPGSTTYWAMICSLISGCILGASSVIAFGAEALLP